ncbi:hypothetical protein VNO80_20484 [Phaseolus coccineus]|uniref:Uncharacterized protein n=1 Tax=Phaseolus coccineus TaxID=3886 RepID=A0AAN9M201_PHACN
MQENDPLAAVCFTLFLSRLRLSPSEHLLLLGAPLNTIRVLQLCPLRTRPHSLGTFLKESLALSCGVFVLF